MKLIYLKSAFKCNSFDVTIGIKILFLEFRLLLSRITPYYSSLPWIVWLFNIYQLEYKNTRFNRKKENQKFSGGARGSTGVIPLPIIQILFLISL